MIYVAPGIYINEDDLQIDFVQAGGPGGQNVNKVATAVQLKYPVERAGLPPEVRERLAQLAGKRLTADGLLLIQARRYRRQEQNRQDAIDRLVKLLAQAAAPPPKPRRATKPGQAARARRLEKKRHRSQTKQLRGKINTVD